MWQSLKNGWYWLALPLRLLGYGLRYAFGRPLLFIGIFAVLAALGFFEGWDTEAALTTCLMGTLIIWFSECLGGHNPAWPAPSPFRPPPKELDF